MASVDPEAEILTLRSRYNTLRNRLYDLLEKDSRGSSLLIEEMTQINNRIEILLRYQFLLKQLATLE